MSFSVQEIRAAYRKVANGNECKTKKFPALLKELNINLNQPTQEKFFAMLDTEGKGKVSWHSLYRTLENGFRQMQIDMSS